MYVVSYISNRLISKSQHLASCVSQRIAIAYDSITCLERGGLPQVDGIIKEWYCCNSSNNQAQIQVVQTKQKCVQITAKMMILTLSQEYHNDRDCMHPESQHKAQNA
jgi:hypothetical protein